MDIFETRDTIERWIYSCDKEEQINLLADVVSEFVVIRFEKKANIDTIEDVRGYLIQKMAEQKLLIRRKSYLN